MDNQNKTIGIQKVEKSIVDRLDEITSKITSVEEWENYIFKYQDPFCKILASLEAGRNNNNQSTSNEQKPIAVIFGGQPGAGKTALIPKYKQLLKEQYNIDALVNNADFYRFCVPGTYKVASDFPESASVLTDPVVKSMRKNLVKEAIEQKQSIIIENTLGDTLMVDEMKEANVHDIWIALMAVPREESLLSDFERYIKMKEASDVARLVSIEAHDKRYSALDKIAIKLENEGVRMLVHSRGKDENSLPNLEYDSSDNSNKRYANVIDAMNSVRNRSFKANVSGYSERLKTIREKMEAFGMTEDEEIELKTLEEIIEKSIAKEKEGEEK